MVPKLIITADDYGLCDEVNDGIRDCIQNGAVTSVQVLANMVTDTEMQKLLLAVDLSEKKWGKRCGIGLHFNTTEGPALYTNSNSTLIAGEHNGQPVFYSIKTIDCGKINTADLQHEFDLQFERLAQFLGGSEYIDSVSSHHNIHLFSVDFLDAMLQRTADKIPFRSPVQWRSGGDNPEPRKFKKWFEILPIVPDSLKTWAEAGSWSTKQVLDNAKSYNFLNAQRARIHEKQHQTPVNCSEQWYGQPGYDCLLWIVQELKRLQQAFGEQPYVSELFTHIASAEGNIQRELTYSMPRRVAEYDVWKLYKVKKFIEECHKGFHPVELCSYKDALLMHTLV